MIFNELKIYKIEEFDLDNLIYSNPLENKGSQTKMIYIKYNDQKLGAVPAIIQIPDLFMIDDIKTLNSKYITHEILLPLVGKTTNSTKQVKNFFNALDKKIINDSECNIDIWPFDHENMKYKMLIQKLENKDKLNDNSIYDNGIIKFKLIKSKEFKTNVFTSDKNKIKTKYYEDIISGGCYIKSIIEIVAIWIKDNIFGIYIRPHQFRVSDGNPPVFTLKNYSFIDDSGESDDQNDYLCDTEVDDNDYIKYCDTKKNDIEYDNLISDTSESDIESAENKFEINESTNEYQKTKNANGITNHIFKNVG